MSVYYERSKMSFFSGINQLLMNGLASRVFGSNPMTACNDDFGSLFGCQSMGPTGAMDAMFGMSSMNSMNGMFGMNNFGMMGGILGNNFQPFMQMLGAMFGMTCGYQGLDLLNFMNNWSMVTNNMMNSMQGMNGMGGMSGMGGMNPMGGQFNNFQTPFALQNPQSLGNGNALVSTAARYLGMNEQQVEGATGSRLADGLWCAGFVRETLKQTYGNNLPAWYKNCNTNSCSEVLNAARQNGKSFKNGGAAQPGDLIVFNTSRGQARHIGIVSKIENGKVYTIEGNSGGKVSQRVYDIGNTSRINSYIRMG